MDIYILVLVKTFWCTIYENSHDLTECSKPSNIKFHANWFCHSWKWWM